MIGGFKCYPVIRDACFRWLGEVPEHWKVKQLGRIGRFSKGSGGTKEDEVVNGIPCVRYGDLYMQHQFFIRKSRACIAEKKKSVYTMIRYGDVLFAGSGETIEEIGKSAVNLISKPAYCGGDVIIFRSSIQVDASFLGYATDCPQAAYQKSCMGRGITVMHIYSDELKYMFVALPPLPEQTTIVRYLDYFDRRIRRYIHARQKLIKLLEEQKQVVIHRAVIRGLDSDVPLKPSGVEWLGEVPGHWKVQRLRNTAEMRVSNVDKHVKEGETPVRLCNYVDVYKNDCISEHINFMRVTATPEEIKRFRLQEDDVLITKDSETWDDIGVPALVTDSASDLISGYHLALLRPYTEKLVGGYLLRALQSKGLAYQFHVEAKGVTRYGLSHSGIKSAWMPLPPLPEQTAIVKYLDKTTADLDTAITRARRGIDLLQEYRTRLIADVVTGKLDVREAAAALPDESVPLSG